MTLMPDWLPQFLLNFMPVAFFAGCAYECVHELREKKRAKEVERKEKRREVVANVFDHGLLTSNEVRSICNDCDEWEEVRFYADDRMYMMMRVRTIPSEYGTKERK